MSRTFKLVLLVFLILGAWDAVLFRGRSVPKDSYIDRKNDFSLLPPHGWRPAASDEHVAFMLIGPGVGRGSPSINVVVIPGDLPSLDGHDLDGLARSIEGDIRKTFGPFARDSVKWRNVDGIRAVEMSGVLGSEAGGLGLVQTWVRGYQKHYLLTFVGSSDPAAEDRRAYESVLASFRVLRRPSLF